MADTIATREFIERTLDERVGVINTRLQNISGSTAENTADLLSAISSDINETFSRMAQEGITVESNVTSNLKTALVRTINKIAEESAGSGGGGGGTVTPPAEEEPVNLLKAPFTLTEDMTSDGYGEAMELLDYSFGFEIGKYYIAKGTYGENNTPFELPAMVINMEGMIMFYGISAEEDFGVVVYDKFAFDEDSGAPVPSDTNSVAMLFADVSKYPTPITVDSISLMNRNSNCLNDIQVPNDSITTTYWHYQDDGIDAYCPIVLANIPTDKTVADGTIKAVTLKVGDRTLVCDGLMLGKIEAEVGGYTEDGLEFNSFFETEMGGGALTLIKGYRANYYTMNEETGDFDYELIKDDSCMCIVGYFTFMDAIAQEEVKDIVYYRPTILEALSVSDKVVEEAVDVFVSGNQSPEYADFNFFDLTKVDRIRDYAFSGFSFSNKDTRDIYVPENINYVGEYAFTGISAGYIEFDENCMQDHYNGTLLRFDDANFYNIKLRSKDWASFKNARQSSSEPIYMASPASISEGMFQGARLFSVNSENQGEWIFNNDDTPYLNIREKAFAISVGGPNTATLTFNYPSVTSLYLNNPHFNFNKVTINVPNCIENSSFFRIDELSLKEFTINTSDERGHLGYFEVGGGDGLEKLVVPHYGVQFARHNYNRSTLKYLDVYRIEMVFNEDGNALGAFSNLETLILRSAMYDLDKYLTSDSNIMLGVTPVYVSDQNLDFYRTEYAHTAIVFKGISELV